MSRHRPSPRRFAACAALVVASAMPEGCATSRWTPLDPCLVTQARRGLSEDPTVLEPPVAGPDDFETPTRRAEGSLGEVVLGEIIAIFPGLIVPGLGHRYSGDSRTANQLLRVGGTGLALGAIGGGVALGGYALDQTDEVPGVAFTLYATGGTVGAIGIAYFLVAWVYDVVDTPRAVRSGGRPPPRSAFVDSLDIWGD